MTQLPLIDEYGFEVWDSTKLQSYLDCMKKGQLGYEQHLVPNYPSEALAFGVAFHKAVEVWTNEQRENKDTDGITPVSKARLAFLQVWEHELPQELREKLEFEGNRRSYGNFCRLFDAYIKKFPLEMFDSILGVEIPFALRLGETPKGEVVFWHGVIDRIVRWQGGVYYVDLKTGSYPLAKTFDEYKFRGQFFGYAWASQQLLAEELAGVMIQGVYVMAPPKTSRATRTVDDLVGADIVPISPEQIEEWKQDTLYQIDQIHTARAAGRYVMNRGAACNYYGGCAYKQLCIAPDLREYRTEQHFVRRVWNPADRSREGAKTWAKD